MVAIRSAPMPCGTKPVVEVGLRVHRPGAAVGGHRHARHRLDAAGEDQVLPAGRHLLARPWLTASRPEAQKRLSCTPATCRGSPRRSRRCVAMSPPWSPTGETQPEDDVVDPAGFRSGLRVRSSSSRPTTRDDRLHECSDPVALPSPARGADGVVDVCLGHGWQSLRYGSSAADRSALLTVMMDCLWRLSTGRGRPGRQVTGG